MKLAMVAMIAVAGLGSSGCTPDWATDNETPFILEIADITNAQGELPILADVSFPVVNDEALVSINVFRKNNNPDLSTSPVEHVYLKRYEVRYFRTDGHSVEGVDVPHRITGALNSIRLHTPTDTGEIEVEAVITAVRQQAKLEPPLLNLRGGNVSTTGNFLLPGQAIITTVAEITVYARQITTGEPLSATGRFQVTFADFGD